MQVGLFIPCYIDQFYPSVGKATVRLLEQLDIDFEYPASQTCCGQPMANVGCADDAVDLAEKFLEDFKHYERVVCPSGSCVSMIRHHYDQLVFDSKESRQLRQNTFELCEFLYDVVQVRSLNAHCPKKVGLQMSCHGLRELRLGPSSEMQMERIDKVRMMLRLVNGIEVVDPQRLDECCGFGGTFAVSEEATSTMMGEDRLDQFESAGAEVITATDMSCLMHLDGLIRRKRKKLRVAHIAEILAGDLQ